MRHNLLSIFIYASFAVSGIFALFWIGIKLGKAFGLIHSPQLDIEVPLIIFSLGLLGWVIQKNFEISSKLGKLGDLPKKVDDINDKLNITENKISKLEGKVEGCDRRIQNLEATNYRPKWPPEEELKG